MIAAGVNIAGVQVGGLTRDAARDAVIAQYVAPRRAKLPVTFRGRTLAIDPVKVGYVADVNYALDGALLFGRSKAVPPEGVRSRCARRSTASACGRCSPCGRRRTTSRRRTPR